VSLRYDHPDVRTEPVYVTPSGRVLGKDEARGPRAKHDPNRRRLVYTTRHGDESEFVLPSCAAESLSWIIAGLRETVYVPDKAVTA
jgi:hypothetical protein